MNATELQYELLRLHDMWAQHATNLANNAQRLQAADEIAWAKFCAELSAEASKQCAALRALMAKVT